MTPEYLEELADLADPKKLWRLPGADVLNLPKEEAQQLHTGVALRRYATHLRRVNNLRGSGQSLLITPLSTNGSASMVVPTPEKHEKLKKGHT